MRDVWYHGTYYSRRYICIKPRDQGFTPIGAKENKKIVNLRKKNEIVQQ